MDLRIFVAAGMGVLATCVHAAPGSLDPDFGSGGTVVTSLSLPYESEASAIAMTRDGRVLVGGYSYDGTANRLAFARYNAQGALDPAFGTGGKLVTSVSGNVAGMAIASDGSIVAVASDCKIARFLSTGSLDTQFGNAGVLAPAPCTTGRSVAIDASGRILVLGEDKDSSDRNVVVMRFTAQGLVDSSFNSTGRASMVPPTPGVASARNMAIAPSGKILALAAKSPCNNCAEYLTKTILVGRFNTDGTADGTFGVAGFVETSVSPPSAPFPYVNDVGNAIAVDFQERAVVVGVSQPWLLPAKRLVIRYAPEGALDTSFNGAGFAWWPSSFFYGVGAAYGVALQPDGKILVAGKYQDYGDGYGPAGPEVFTVARYLANGTLDATFGSGGMAAAGFGGPASAGGIVLGNLDLGGEILVVGRANTAGVTSVVVAALEGDDPPRMYGVSTRMPVLTGDDVMIGGFIIGGTAPKTVTVRARGPSLGVNGALADPVLTLVPADGSPATINDDWGSDANAAALAAAGYQPGHPKEAAIMRTLPPGGYTAIVTGTGNTTGVAIIEIYEMDSPEAPLIGISTRGRVQTGDNVMIGGFIIQGDGPQTVVVRARGPSLGVAGALLDPVLALVPAGGGPILVNDDWQTDAASPALASSGYAPTDPRESAMLVTLPRGAFTAIVSGKSGTTGVAIVEVYKVGP